MKNTSLLLIGIFLFLVSCSDETTVFSESQDEIALESSEEILDNSIIYDTAGVLDITSEDQISGKTSKKSTEEQAGDYPLTLVAQIKPPYFNSGKNLTASHVHVVGDYAYVAYNTVDDDYAGGIDIIDVSNPNKPRVTSRLYYSNADINALKYKDGYVYAVGGVDSETSVRATANSFVAKIRATNGRLNLSGIQYGFQEGFVGTDLEVTANTIMVTSGKDGFFTIYDKNTAEIIEEYSFLDLRSVALKEDKIALLDGSVGVHILDQNYAVTNVINIDTDFGIAKRTIAFSGEHIIVSEGSKGAGVYNYSTGSLVEYIPILINPAGVALEDIVTNGVAVNEEVLLMANGGAGLCLSEQKNNGANLVGIIELNGSTNYVETKGDYIFAATGKAGLQIIKMNKPDESLAARCSTLSGYSGSSRLVVSDGVEKAYRGSKRFKSINVSGSLLLCGSWTVRNQVDIEEDALFEMNGNLVVGRYNKRKNITVEEGATLRIEGNLIIYGNLILEDNATIEFIGDASAANIFGNVTKASSATVTGEFDDVRDKF
ncbi:MAG: hypothetical protein V3U92_00345 [Cellulophaga sp.]